MRLPISKFSNIDDAKLGYKVQNSTSVMGSHVVSRNRYKRGNINPDIKNRLNSITPKLQLPGTAGNVGIGSLGSTHLGQFDNFS